MTSPMVDSVRTVPLGADREAFGPVEAETDSGFPFDDREDRDDNFRSQLDDIAKRHPELAEHLEGFPFRSDTLGRRRPPRPEPDFGRFGRPFGARFGFPFGEPFDEAFPQPSPPPQPQPEPQPQSPPPEPKSKPERGRKQNIQPSNTVDLGQKQEPVNDRSQRSMSAPPDHRQRYVSSIHIPINPMGDMGKAQSQPDKPVERVIPIHVEGRDEPVMPKNAAFAQGQSHPQSHGQGQSHPQSHGPGQPQPERIFGHSPSHFTQFVGPQGFGQQKPATPPPKPQEQKPEKPKEAAPKTNTPIDLIQSIQKDVSELMGQVEKFAGVPRDKQYLYLDEMLTRNLIKLDDIDTQGQENIRQARKEAIKCIQSCISILEAKAAANVVPEKAGDDSAESPPGPAETKMDVEEKDEGVESRESEKKDGEEKSDKAETTEEKMEVAAEAPPVAEAPKEEPQVSEATEGKADEEMKEAPPEESKQGDAASVASQDDDKKEKKKGKKVVKK